jgi:hypothetical protein
MGVPFQVHDRSGAIQDSPDWSVCHITPQLIAAPVLAEIQRGRTLAGLSPTQRAELTRLSAYLERHREHIDYQRYKELGLPTGSGMVESTCKWLIQQRFKGVGMRWSENGFTHLLHLRLCWVNGRFDSLFPGVPPN